MASSNHLPPDEALDAEQTKLLIAALQSRVAPASEGSGAGSKAWTAFFEIDSAKGGLGGMSISAVITRAGVARPPFATVGGRFRLLRQAIREAGLRERAKHTAPKVQDPGDDDLAADRDNQRAETKETLRRRLQVSDSLNASYLARALEGERKAKAQTLRSEKFLAELNEYDAQKDRGD